LSGLDPALSAMNPMTEGVYSRMIRALGREKALRLGNDALAALGLKELKTPNELLAFANHLISLGGVAESVGRALKVSAILRGASEKAA
jgi:hypothetical protein